jgi:L-lactate dehydrogenase (cytochrome)
MKPANIADYRTLARRRLPHFLFEYMDGGSYDEVTLRRNISDLEQIALRQRVLRDVATIDTTTTLFGQSCAMPVALAPVGLAGMNARRGECQAVRAAEQAGPSPFRQLRPVQSKKWQPPRKSHSGSSSTCCATESLCAT